MRSLTLAALSVITLPLALLVAPTATPAQDGPILLSPEAVGQIFCIARVGNDMSPVAGVMTADLAATVIDSLRRSAEWGDAHPGEKPPLGDGVPWASFPDYAPGCAVGPVTYAGGKALVTISYTFPDDPDASASDQLLLVAVPDGSIGASRLRLDNAVFADESDMRQALNLAFVDY